MVKDAFKIVGKTLVEAFYIEEAIAEGGFGVVYRAEHAQFRAPVALKCLKIPSNMEEDRHDDFIERFRAEAEILFHLSAAIPEVVRPLHVDTFRQKDGTVVPFMAMEWVDGEPLDAILIRREHAGQPPPSLAESLAMLDPIAQALARAHRFQVPGGAVVSVTHCDLKPENIIITPDSSSVRAKILDYGIAKARELALQSAGRISESEGANPFTPSYGAPEQWVPKRYGQSGPWTDVWGLALTLVECLCGRPPIEGDMHAMMGTALDKARRPSPRSEGVEVSDEVEAVFLKAMEVDPRDRYKSIDEFWEALYDAAGLVSSAARGSAPALELNLAEKGVSEAPPSQQQEVVKEAEAPAPVERAAPAPAISPKFDLDIDADMPSSHSKPHSMRIAKATIEEETSRRGPRSGIVASSREGQAMSKQLRLPLQLFLVGVVVTLIDAAARRLLGEALSIGPVRLHWISAFFGGAAVLAAFLSFMRDDSDES